MSSRTPALPARIADPARTAAVNAIRFSIDEHLEWIGELVDEYLADGNPMALTDARDKLMLLADRIDALDQLGPPTAETTLHPELA